MYKALSMLFNVAELTCTVESGQCVFTLWMWAAAVHIHVPHVYTYFEVQGRS